MSRKFFSIVTLGLCSLGVLFLSPPAKAEILLTRATVQELRNKVLLVLQSQSARPARRADVMNPGDALTTDRKAFAELRFNDRSLARIGERAIFRFLPNTRTFYLNNGTVLLLIPPGQGRTRVRTPNAAAGIRGSGLFVRYSPDTNVTLVGALTNSDIEISNENDTQVASQSYVLQAGQIAVVAQNRIERILNFDLRTFYETSEIVRGLDLPLSSSPNSDPAIAAVQAETSEALKQQPKITGQDIVENPSFVRLEANSPTPTNPAFQNTIERDKHTRTSSPQISPADPAVMGRDRPGNPGNPTGPGGPTNRGDQPRVPPINRPDPTPPVNRPDPTPPINRPDPTPPVNRPDPTPPVNRPDPTPPINRPDPTPPVNRPDPTPPVNRPDPTPPVTTPPVTTPPVTTPPVTTPPVTTPPVTTPPVTTPPVTTPPVTTPPVTTPPVTTPPVVRPDPTSPNTTPIPDQSLPTTSQPPAYRPDPVSSDGVKSSI